MLNSRPARHRAPSQRVLLRAGLLATVLGAAALGSGGQAAMAAEHGGTAEKSGVAEDLDAAGRGGAVAVRSAAEGLAAPARETVRGTGIALARTLETVTGLQLDPLANTGTDPLDNAVGTQVADFRAVSTAALTGPLARGASLGELPLVGPVANGVIDALPR
ncbi:hypothetical protein [Streptomyces sp. NPDC007083]|uniref:hypothetical protein n=1 Tax=unclassified Streptomyces TaxID=2593676 RepID=UPI00340A5AAB